MATDSPSSCSVADLELILRKGGICIAMPMRPIDEVYENVYVGGESAAKNKAALQHIGITHVLNCAVGSKFFQVNTNQEFYNDVGIKFLGLPISDFAQADIKQHFATTAQFIDEVLAQENGKILIHCVQGFSRSATIAIAYLMMRRGMAVREAVRTVREKREIGPNQGFLKQLCVFNDELQK